MIITCINCNKKFDINSDLIPKNGRLLECSSCNHQWFFKIEKDENILKSPIKEQKYIVNKNEETLESPKKEQNQINKNRKLLKDVKPTTNNIEIIKKKEFLKESNIKKKKKKLKIQNLIIVFFISFIAFIILIDTFKYPIGKIIPNIEFLLNNLYESIKDIRLFFNDLI